MLLAHMLRPFVALAILAIALLLIRDVRTKTLGGGMLLAVAGVESAAVVAMMVAGPLANVVLMIALVGCVLLMGGAYRELDGPKASSAPALQPPT